MAAEIKILRSYGPGSEPECFYVVKTIERADKILTNVYRENLIGDYYVEAPEYLLGRRARLPRCQVCKKRDASFLAGSSSNQGKKIRWNRICSHCIHGWNEGGDWIAPIYPIGPGRYRSNT